jgi:hypothetical protein
MSVHGTDGEIFSLTVSGLGTNWLTVHDAAGNEIEPAIREVPPPPAANDANQGIPPIVYFFDIPGYRTVMIHKFPELFEYHHAFTPVPFVLTYWDGRIYGVSQNWNIIDMNEEIPAWGFEGRETWGSNRGYIWSRSFPLMFTPRALTIGHGPDTFINVFPMFDMVNRQLLFYAPYKVVDKAHNLLIQTWISSGALSAIALFALFGHYLLTTFISLVKSKDEPLFSYGLRLGLLCGVSAYVMSNMATDTTIGSTGVFFVLLGVGYGLNNNLRIEVNT